jgi:hypothetical protein
LHCRQFQDSLLQQAVNTTWTSPDFERRLQTVFSSAGPASDADADSGYTSISELLLSNQHVLPQLFDQLLHLLQYSSEGRESRSWLLGVLVELLSHAEVGLQLCDKAAMQLPDLLDTAQYSSSYITAAAVMHITAAAAGSDSLRHALRQHAAQVLAVVQRPVNARRRISMKLRRYHAAVIHTILWMLWDPVFDEPAAAPAAAAEAAAVAVADFLAKLALEARVPAGHLQWPPVNMQLLQRPEFLDCMLALLSGPTPFAVLFLERIVALQGGAAVLATPQRMQRIAEAAEVLVQALQRAAPPPPQQQQQQGAFQAGWAAAEAHLLAQEGKEALRSVVQLLEFCMAMFANRQGLLALAPHTDMLQRAAAALQLVPAAWSSGRRLPTEEQVAACRNWAEGTAATAAAALQEAEEEYAEAYKKLTYVLVHELAPARAQPRSFIKAAYKFGAVASRVVELQQLLVLAGAVPAA